jgi:pilus assembly protein Flp/PilA
MRKTVDKMVLSKQVEVRSQQMKNLFARFANDESGATAIEYGLIAGLISIAIVTAVTTAGGSISSIFTTVSTKLTAAQGNVK